MTNVMPYDDLTARYEAAYAAHEKMYTLKVPLPAAPQGARADWTIIGTLIALVMASVIVSGSRTIHEFGGGVVGFAAFVMLEVGIVAYGYIAIKRSPYSAARHEHVQRRMRAGMLLALFVAIAANMHAVLRPQDTDTSALSSIVNIAINVLVAISAPVLAFIAGDVLGMEAVAARSARQRAQAEYDAAMAHWREGMNKAWATQKARLGIRVEVMADADSQADVSAPRLSVQTDSRQTGYGFTRTSDGARRVADHLQQYPADADLTLRALGERVGVNKDTAAKGKAIWKEGRS
jgi:hypothetical protein